MAELLLRSKLTRYSFKQVVGSLPTLLLLLGVMQEQRSMPCLPRKQRLEIAGLLSPSISHLLIHEAGKSKTPRKQKISHAIPTSEVLNSINKKFDGEEIQRVAKRSLETTLVQETYHGRPNGMALSSKPRTIT